MPCPKCKKKTASTWSFCPYCGVELPPNEKLRRGRIRGKGKNRAMTISPKIMPYVTAAIDSRTEGPVWRNEHGDKMSYDQWRDAFNCTLESLGIPTSAHPAPDGRYLTPHCCRHTARSLMDHAAGTERAKMALIGHASDEMSKLYTHQELRDLKEVTDSM